MNIRKIKGPSIKCPRCGKDCRFKWQQFKNDSKHIRQECPIHGFIRYAPQTEQFIILANEYTDDTKQSKLFE